MFVIPDRMSDRRKTCWVATHGWAIGPIKWSVQSYKPEARARESRRNLSLALRACIGTKTQTEELASSIRPPGRASVAIGDRNMDAVKFYGFNLADQSYRTLIEMPSEKYQGAASDGKSLFLAFDGSVLVIDMRSGAVHDFAYVFEDSNARNKPIISRMLVDRDVLVVLARGGKAATFNLDKFYIGSNPRQTPYWKSSKELSNWQH